MNEKEIRFIDLFGGIGGFRLGLERANYNKSTTEKRKSKERRNGDINEQRNKLHSGSNATSSCIRSAQQKNSKECNNSKNKLDNRQFFNCIWYCDKDKYACQTYNKNFKEQYEPTDIATVNLKNIPDFDMLCAGFPCQSFSIAGKRKGFQDIRGTMFFEIYRITQAKRPRLLFLENVKGLLSADDGRCFATILSSLDELGYDVEWQVLNSKNFGVPQNRERVFIIGHLRGSGSWQVFPLRESNEGYNHSQEAARNEGEWVRGEDTHIAEALQKRDYKGGQLVMRLAHSNNFRRYNQTYNPEGICEALDTSSGSGHQPCVPVSTPEYNRDNLQFPSIRRLTPVECERLQGFPDGWTDGVSDTQRYKQLGNAVTINVIEAIGEAILRSKTYFKGIA